MCWWSLQRSFQEFTASTPTQNLQREYCYCSLGAGMLTLIRSLKLSLPFLGHFYESVSLWSLGEAFPQCPNTYATPLIAFGHSWLMAYPLHSLLLAACFLATDVIYRGPLFFLWRTFFFQFFWASSYNGSYWGLPKKSWISRIKWGELAL